MAGLNLLTKFNVVYLVEKEQQSIGLYSFCSVLQSKDKSKPVGVARQQRHFLCSDKENEAKESLLLAEGYVVHGATATAIQ
jgi:hypothetical protein